MTTGRVCVSLCHCLVAVSLLLLFPCTLCRDDVYYLCGHQRTRRSVASPPLRVCVHPSGPHFLSAHACSEREGGRERRAEVGRGTYVTITGARFSGAPHISFVSASGLFPFCVLSFSSLAPCQLHPWNRFCLRLCMPSWTVPLPPRRLLSVFLFLSSTSAFFMLCSTLEFRAFSFVRAWEGRASIHQPATLLVISRFFLRPPPVDISLALYVCVYTYVCIYMHTHTHVCVHMHTCLSVSVRAK